MRYAAVILAAAVAVCSSCSYLKKKDEVGPPPVVRYMNLKAVYSYVLNKNRDALGVKKKLDEKMARTKEIERDLDEPSGDHVALLDEYRRLASELAALKGRSKYYKGIILTQIDRAVKNVAKKMKIDFVINIGDELIYARKEYDITEDVLLEITRIDERRAPEAR
ncbi:MAG TPA: OmpH family outer membrane protein [Spirochaetota bacterium]|nr:OmpH family outer membrane protein [Spirochaetota bacterium]HPC41659.1 OmpH family outer membrane protein [Spirochaetota bacterium]HPL16336.1 OmpH family outer membrane protein [Spirochaetota bacterium]HQF09316.1 OmpH family outer membrane protein [Spirochaetota bacterium]HQH98264.1 OmpH family outer membrane protein [Spirochaetota bacterium]